MALTTLTEVAVERETDVFRARTEVRRLATELGFSDIGVAEIEIAASELGTNIVRHGGGSGRLRFQVVGSWGTRSLEIEARDHGPGLPPAGPDGRTPRGSRGSLGIGLSGVRRLMDEFEAFRENGETVIRTRKWLSRGSGARIPVCCSVYSRPRAGERLSGDEYLIKRMPFWALFGVIDALGHGPVAHEVAALMARIIRDHFRDDLMELVIRCHEGLIGSRGAALALGRIELRTGFVSLVGVGNVATRMVTPYGSTRVMGINGTVGMNITGVQVTHARERFGPESLVVVHSDGVSDRFRLDAEAARRPVGEVSERIMREYGRRTDDATVMVIGAGPEWRR